MNYNKREYSKDESGEHGYPQQLVDYLMRRYNIQGGSTVLDVGCGNGYYVKAFSRHRIFVIGTDRESGVICNFDEHNLPFKDGQFDIIFTKSTLEHVDRTMMFLYEVRRVMKDGGFIICLVPDYKYQRDNFYDDITHVRPFTEKSLKQLFELADFREVQVESFIQLPFLWRHPWLKRPFMALVSLIPDYFKYHKGEQVVWIRHGKERMLLLTAFR